jgi:hypothetical protein
VFQNFHAEVVLLLLFLFCGVDSGTLVLVFLKVWQIFAMTLSGLELLFVGCFLITDSILLFMIYLFRLFKNNFWFKFSRSHMSRYFQLLLDFPNYDNVFSKYSFMILCISLVSVVIFYFSLLILLM